MEWRFRVGMLASGLGSILLLWLTLMELHERVGRLERGHDGVFTAGACGYDGGRR